jgi:hypothetical protein
VPFNSPSCSRGQKDTQCHSIRRAAVEGRKILSAIQFRAKTELKPSPSIYDEEISKLRDAPWDAQTREIAVKLPTFDT